MSALRPRISVLATAAAALAAVLGGFPLAADDRDLLREASGDPYVFFLLDTSGSMHWSPRCLQEDVDAGACTRLCATGDCAVPLNGDDPDSKLHLAKSALYEVINSLDKISFGFATYNQDSLGAKHKHWIYEATSNGVSIPGWGPYPASGQQDVFGFQWSCGPGSGSDTARIGCDASDNRVADLNDAWERRRVERLPKGGDGFNTARTFFVRAPSATKYAITYTPNGGSLGNLTVTMRVRVARCKTSSCTNDFTNRETGSESTISYRRIEQFISWDLAAARSAPQDGYFRQADAEMAPGSNTCAGWDPNTDSTADANSGVNIKYPTVASGVNTLLDVGDVIPLDWRDGQDHKQEILERLAPNLRLGETTPDFSIARYFSHQPGGSGNLTLLDGRARPLLGTGSTPLGASVSSFRSWYSGCGSGTCPANSGWRHLAATQPNSDFGCRKTYLIVLTDGDETCSGAPCTATRDLFEQDGVKTFVVAFGVPEGTGNALQCMAANGGTGRPIYPRNKQELVTALTRILEQIREEARSFASAAVPSVQAAVDDKIFLTSFTPLNDESVWAGRLESFLKPLPLTPANLPDRSKVCTTEFSSGCFAWDAAEELYEQRPSALQLAENPPNFNLGEGATERRVLYGQLPSEAGQVPRNRRLFEPPPDPLNPLIPSAAGPDWTDLLQGFGLPLADSAALNKAKTIIRFALAGQSGLIENGPGVADDVTLNYLLGDIFHSNPLVLGGPENFTYFIQNKDGYEQFALKNRVRRKVVFVGANDGQLHAFDAGSFSATKVQDANLICRAATSANRTPEKLIDVKFSNGTGKEIFSFVPRSAMRAIREQSQSTSHVFSVDGPVTTGDVFIDPISTDADPPALNQREWRTVVVGGLREGGSGVYALDVTTPDKITTAPICGLDGIERETPYEVTQGDEYVPYCMGIENAAATADCGPLPYPSVLWEFEDKWDEDGDGFADLGRTWSIPAIGRIQVCETQCNPAAANNDIHDRYVAIFGGGLHQPDVEQPVDYSLPGSGNFLYMIDIATGKILYKSKLWTGGAETTDGLDGMVPSEPAVIDTNLDGYVDRVYVGTTSGKLYKWDLSAPGRLATHSVLDASTGQVHSVTRIRTESWAPLAIFDAEDRPIFFPPSVVFVSESGQFALTFGTGDRASLWEDRSVTGRFFSILDEDFAAGDAFLPLTAAAYPEIVVDDATPAQFDDNLFLNPATSLRPGWYFELTQEERVITRPFVLSGVLFFTSYQPDIRAVVVGDDDDDDEETVCASSGVSRVFTVLAANGTAVFREQVDAGRPELGTRPGSRFRNVPEFVTDPFVELSTTKNKAVPRDDPNDPADDQRYVDDLCTGLESVSETLDDFFPDSCKFANYSYNIETIRSDRGLVCIAPVPICIVEQNWTEK